MLVQYQPGRESARLPTDSRLLLISGVLLTLRNPDDYQPSRAQIPEEKVA
jgi:hypothetical protein